MTTFEHAMVGITGTLAAGAQCHHGWKIVAFAGLVAVLPDWDGLTILGGMQLFDQAHRLWGHNLLVAGLLTALLAALDYRFDLITRVVIWTTRLLRRGDQNLQLREPHQRTVGGYLIWLVVGVVAALGHLLADLVFSGAPGLTDWHLQLLWPISSRRFIYPLVSWGDPGATLIFVAGMFAMVRWRAKTQAISACTLAAVVLYVLCRGWLR